MEFSGRPDARDDRREKRMAKRKTVSERINLRPPAQSRSRESTQALLEIGTRLIEERGIDGTGMNDVAAAAGSSVGALYFRFGNKERFVSEVMQQHLGKTRERLGRVLARIEATATSPRDVIDTMTRWIVRGFEQNQGLLRAQLRRALDYPDEWGPFRKLGQEIVEGTLKLLQRFPEVRNDEEWQMHVRIAMQMIFGTLNNVLINQPGPLELGDPTSSRELSRAVIRYLGWEKTSRSNQGIKRLPRSMRHRVRGSRC